MPPDTEGYYLEACLISLLSVKFRPPKKGSSPIDTISGFGKDWGGKQEE